MGWRGQKNRRPEPLVLIGMPPRSARASPVLCLAALSAATATCRDRCRDGGDVVLGVRVTRVGADGGQVRDRGLALDEDRDDELRTFRSSIGHIAEGPDDAAGFVHWRRGKTALGRSR